MCVPSLSRCTSPRLPHEEYEEHEDSLELRDLDSMSITSPVPPFVTVALGSAYFRAERFADAEREYRAAIAADPKLGEAHNNLAVAYLMTGRYAEAEQEVKAAEKAGFKVNPRLKDDIKNRRSGSE